MFKRNRPLEITQEQYDAAALALFKHATGHNPTDEFISADYDGWFVTARVVLEAAGVKVP